MKWYKWWKNDNKHCGKFELFNVCKTKVKQGTKMFKDDTSLLKQYGVLYEFFGDMGVSYYIIWLSLIAVSEIKFNNIWKQN